MLRTTVHISVARNTHLTETERMLSGEGPSSLANEIYHRSKMAIIGIQTDRKNPPFTIADFIGDKYEEIYS